MGNPNIETGRYLGRASGELALGEANSGSPQIGVNIDLLNPDTGERFDSVTFYGSLSGGAVPITLRQLRDMGWTGDDFDDSTGLGSVNVDVSIYYKEWEGKMQQKISIYAAGAGVRMAKPLDDRRKAALQAQLKGAILQSKAALPAAAKATTPTNGARPAWAAGASTNGGGEHAQTHYTGPSTTEHDAGEPVYEGPGDGVSTPVDEAEIPF